MSEAEFRWVLWRSCGGQGRLLNLSLTISIICGWKRWKRFGKESGVCCCPFTIIARIHGSGKTRPFCQRCFLFPGIQYKMDDILSFLMLSIGPWNLLYWQEVMTEVIIELLRFVDALCFKRIWSWDVTFILKRGLQLNYNVTRLEGWCKGHEIHEGSAYLSHLLQAAVINSERIPWWHWNHLRIAMP